MKTALITHSDCLAHETPVGHPECPDRLRSILAALETEDFLYLIREEAPRAEREALLRAHPATHVDKIMALVPRMDQEDFHFIDGDTCLSPGSGDAALRAAGAVVRAVDGVFAGDFQNAFCAVRPPGHHAERDTAMGFCFFNNAAVGAHHARAVHGAERVAVIDFDVHHGNGTQDIFQADPNLFYASTHQSPLYPGTGLVHERGVSGNILNAPLPPGAKGSAFREVMEAQVLPAVEAFKPGLIMISAGFDGHAADPLGQLRLREHDFAWATTALMGIAQRCCGSRLVSVLEGGYDLQALASSSAAHLRALMELH